MFLWFYLYFFFTAYMYARLNDIRFASVWLVYFISVLCSCCSPSCPLSFQWVAVSALRDLLSWFFLIFPIYFYLCVFWSIVHAQIRAILFFLLNVVVLEILNTHMSGLSVIFLAHFFPSLSYYFFWCLSVSQSVGLCFFCHLFVYFRWRLLLSKVLLLVMCSTSELEPLSFFFPPESKSWVVLFGFFFFYRVYSV